MAALWRTVTQRHSILRLRHVYENYHLAAPGSPNPMGVRTIYGDKFAATKSVLSRPSIGMHTSSRGAFTSLFRKGWLGPRCQACIDSTDPVGYQTTTVTARFFKGNLFHS